MNIDDYCYLNTGGYDWSAGMSNRAVRAYEYGCMPKSKWTKEIIIEKVLEESEKLTVDDLKPLTKQQLSDFFLVYDSWHHTSSAFNKTDFYGIREDIEDITVDMLPQKEKRIKKEKVQEANMYITARVKYRISVKGRRSWHSEYVEDVVFYRTTDKMVKTYHGNKRISSLYIVKSVEQKTKFAKKERVM